MTSSTSRAETDPQTESESQPSDTTTAPRTRRELREARADSGIGPTANGATTAPQGGAQADSRRGRGRGGSSQQRPRTRRGVLAAIGNGILIALLLGVIGIAALAIVVPAATGSTALTVLTSSMEPGLPPGTLIVITPTDPAEIDAGDVITYQIVSGEPEVVTHRVVQSLTLTDGERVFVTKGDANPTPDPGEVRDVQIRGVLWYAIPFIGWASAAVTGEARAIAILIVVGALFAYAVWMVVSWLRDRHRARRANTDTGSLGSH